MTTSMKMGFLSKTPRNFTLNDDGHTSQSLTPQVKETAQSTILNNEILNDQQQTQPRKPFNSTTEREDAVQNPYPGPGTYYRDVLYLKNMKNDSKFIGEPCFLSKGNRFDYKYSDTPGPSDYSRHKNWIVELPDYKKQNQLSPLRHYQPDPSKLIKPKTKEPGPGDYHINLKWTKQAVSNKINKPMTTDNLINQKIKRKEEEANSYSARPKLDIEITDYSYNKRKRENLKQMTTFQAHLLESVKKGDDKQENKETQYFTKRIKQDEEKLKEKIERQSLLTELSETGYLLYKRCTMPYNQNFCSSSYRFTQQKLDQNTIGPGEYIKTIIHSPKILFKPRHYINKQDRYGNIRNQSTKFNNSNEDNNKKVTEKSYASLNLNEEKSNTRGGMIDFKEKKFASFDKSYSNPGPGSYHTEISSFDSNRNPIPSYTNTCSPPLKDRTKPLRPFDKDNGPSSASYNSHLTSTIEYKLNHSNKNSIIRSKIPRFDYNSLLTNINPYLGPGYYDNQISTLKSNVYPFGSSNERNTIFNKIIAKNSDNRREIGPGSYDTRSYFDWNRKSYNVELT